MRKIKKEELENILHFAKERVKKGDTPPWDFENWKKIADGIESLLGPNTIPISSNEINPANSQKSRKRLGSGLRLVDDKYCPDNVRPH